MNVQAIFKRVKAGVIGAGATRTIPVDVPAGWQPLAISPVVGDVSIQETVHGPDGSVTLSNPKPFPVPFALVLVPSDTVATAFHGSVAAQKIFKLIKDFKSAK